MTTTPDEPALPLEVQSGGLRVGAELRGTKTHKAPVKLHMCCWVIERLKQVVTFYAHLSSQL